MSRDADSTPRQFADLALVLSGGGARACYQVGVLAHIVERVPGFRVPILTGVSAGAINAVSLAAYPGRFDGAVRTLCRKWKQLTPDRVYHTGVTSVLRASARWIVQTILRRGAGPGVLQGLMDLGPLRTFLDQAIDFTVIEDNIRKKKLDVLALSATSYTYGRTVTFIHGWNPRVRELVAYVYTLLSDEGGQALAVSRMMLDQPVPAPLRRAYERGRSEATGIVEMLAFHDHG